MRSLSSITVSFVSFCICLVLLIFCINDATMRYYVGVMDTPTILSRGSIVRLHEKYGC